MATQQDLQELLRLQTARKMPMKDAMAQIKALQSVSLRSIQQIADAPLPTVESALQDGKAARALQNACKAHLKRMQTSPTSATSKRQLAGSTGQADQAKRVKYSGSEGFLLGPTDLTPQQLEASLALPLDTDEDRIAQTAVQTNRAPLVLAFAVELLRHTMPEQPPSSRLSIAQAVVSANSRSKAVNIGLEKGPSADEEGFGDGQPRIKVMGREVAVLKRGGYEWKGDEEEEEQAPEEATAESAPEQESTTSTLQADDSAPQPKAGGTPPTNTWSTSRSVSLRQSTFVARATHMTDPAQRPNLLKSLFNTQPNLRSATHNVWAYRVRPAESSTSTYIREASHDDGETGGGDLLLRVMRETNAVDTLVVMSRWFGGILLGPDRWRLMRNVVTSALSERLRRTGIEASLGGEAVWGLDLEAMRNKTKAAASAGELVTHQPEAARSYLLRNFASAPVDDGDAATSPAKKKTIRAQDAEKEENLGLLLGALRLLFDSWADTLGAQELDRRAWGWYTAVRPEVESGPSGWGAKGTLRLKSILDLRRKAS
ncbi:hypothetical protein M406DRAFT_282003 [Cryphonectria parasitica EP155]|uniref:Impact N-terminal domain-containing protein n=1 Tax=Cryphonectria parasitica (strain ATCC 38755 / EP155) TaxID=660469 RepID=A0A9P4XV77_CRYP1|nr:uncharacterized protein M406DRAFT_282003 [Cryphonectria parasitica EP155]KAF3761902.1 hypothetical protein M406DRAFT_282003 [Cryphonectria parasitica EP155]